MIRKLTTFLIAFTVALLAPVSVRAQVPVSANHVADSFQRPVVSAKLCFAPVDAASNPIGFRVGSIQILPGQVCGLVSNGVMQSGLGVAPTPTGIYYHVWAANRTSGAVLRDYGMTPITGSSWTLDTYDPASMSILPHAIAMGTTTTLAPGSSAACTIGGSSPYYLNCGIPKGDTGAQGPAGTAAAAGTAGSVQFNNGNGQMGTDSTLSYDTTTKTLKAGTVAAGTSLQGPVLTLSGTGCGAGTYAKADGSGCGSPAANLAAPGPIGGTTPSTAAFTQISFAPVAAPLAGPTAAINATAGNLNGAYTYRVTFVTALGETDMGSVTGVSNAVSPVSQQVTLTAIPTSASPLVTARKIYRTVAGGQSQEAFLVATISDNTTTTYADNVADGSLGLPAPGVNTTAGTISAPNSPFNIPSVSSSQSWGFNAGTAGWENTFIGNSAGRSNTTGYWNTFVGWEAGEYHTTGNSNTYVGLKSGFQNRSGSFHACLGEDSCNQATSALYITAAGYHAGYWDNGGSNVWVGSWAGQGTGTAQYTGTQNVAIGVTAMENISGSGVSSNVAIGFEAGKVLTGLGNSIIGADAGMACTACSFNFIGGYNAGGAATGISENVLIGHDAGYKLTSGSSNVMIGYFSGWPAAGANYTTTGVDNTFIGANSGPNTASQVSYSFAVGYNASVTASHQGVFGDVSLTDVYFGSVVSNAVSHQKGSQIGGTLYSAAGSGIPTCNSTNLLLRVGVSDATVATPGSTYASGGTYTIAVECIFNLTGSIYTWIID